MQTLTWYTNRLRRMTPREIAWRAQAFIRDQADRPRIALGAVPTAPYDDDRATAIFEGGVRLCEHAPRTPSAEASAASSWRERLVRHADAIADHRFSFFSLDDRHLGNPIDWNRDHESGIPAPLSFASSIDYRDQRVTGDAKVVWEPGRHHQLVVLGRAYRVTADERYAREAVSQIDSWLEQCPFGVGMHWRSPLEVAIRAINWVWTFDLIRPSGMLAGPTAARLLNALNLHAWDVARKYSRGSSANNHRIGEAAGVFIVSTCLPGLKDASRWREAGRRMLEEEIIEQTYPDGGSREQAFGYHMFVLQFLALAEIAARRAGEGFSASFLERLEGMFDFAAAMVEGGPAPSFGDADDGYVIDMGDHRDPRGWLSVGAALCGRPDLACNTGSYGEAAYWLLGRSAGTSTQAPSAAQRALASRAFADSGRYLLQSGTRGGADALSVLVDCGEHGFGSIAAHGHADALSFTLRAFGEDILVDPGTYDYFRFPEWREYFRSTRAHNTIVVDGVDQSEMLGAFMWGHRARASCRDWQPRAGGGRLEAAHDGYARLADPVDHTRHIELDGAARVLTITDQLTMRGAHDVSAYFHFSEACDVSAAGSAIEAVTPSGTVTLEADARLTATLLRASSDPIGGWVSRAYHRKAPSTTVVLSGRFHGDTRLVSRISIGSARRNQGGDACR
jgi:hypothetical protein